MIVYLDLIWLLNVGIDYLLLACTALLLKRRFQHVRMLLGALIASAIVFLMFTPLASWFLHPLVKLVYSAMIVVVSFGYRRMTYFLQGLATFYFVAFITGGGLFALHYFFQTDADVLAYLPGYGLGGPMISWIFVLICVPLVLYFAKQQVASFEVKKVNSEQLVDVECWIDGVCVVVTGFIDTGNQLRDPMTRTPVMIIETHLLYEHFTKEQLDVITSLRTDVDHHDYPLLARMRIVPFRAVGQAKPFLAALKPDRVRLTHGGDVYETRNVLIGLYERTLSPEATFQCIVHPQLIQKQAVS
ncbi:sigma-E processing peptidase SpoIIGA [Shouchella lonarensis]|uniref:Sporulation sigma-E factor-processing peptidase n=1 Tax=Shouchella lonarensis TaxID=1464122 RepID=A0A1G6KWX9_9BACI|nr:sigma-E processing peptidase SpoIIGA [Shouchella lonarensis]SDC35467.1 sporulation factor SpoIIGA. Unknown type peptidase. MEROPS family U04 [Shouchella lonarensis]